MPPGSRVAVWFARVALGAVFVWNLSAALAFLTRPERYAAGFELIGPAGEAIVQGLGVLFLMWNATYPPVIWQPRRHTTLFLVVLIQQCLAVAGEVWIGWGLPAGHPALRATWVRFLAFDLGGLLLMVAGFVWLRRAEARGSHSLAP